MSKHMNLFSANKSNNVFTHIYVQALPSGEQGEGADIVDKFKSLLVRNTFNPKAILPSVVNENDRSFLQLIIQIPTEDFPSIVQNNFPDIEFCVLSYLPAKSIWLINYFNSSNSIYNGIAELPETIDIVSHCKVREWLVSGVYSKTKKQLNPYSLDDEAELEITGVSVQARDYRYQRILVIHTSSKDYQLLAENTTHQPSVGPVMTGLDLYYVNVDQSEFELATLDGKVKFPLQFDMISGLYEDESLSVRNEGLLVTGVSKYHKSWDFASKTHTYLFGGFEVRIDIGAIQDFIISITNITTGEVTKY